MVLLPEMERILARAVCDWAGLGVSDAEMPAVTRDLVLLFESAVSVGPRFVRGRLARRRLETWLAATIASVRTGSIQPNPERALAVISAHRDLSPRVAAAELLNVLRPTVAVSRYIVFCVHALHRFPRYARAIVEGYDELVLHFVQEVRRLYPFFPMVAARVREDFVWNAMHFPRGRRVLFDLHGTNRDGRIWDHPEEFRPERFRTWAGDPFSLMPQGSGDDATGHRCAGEWLTIELMKTAVRVLTRTVTYRVPERDLALVGTPAAPRGGLVIDRVRPLPIRRASTEARR